MSYETPPPPGERKGLLRMFGKNIWALNDQALISASDMTENIHFGKWLAGGELMQWMSSLQMQVWWAAIIVGTVASANLKAAQILYGPARVITFFLGTVLPIRFTRTLKSGGKAALHRSVRQVCQIIVPLAGAYCMFMAAFPKQLLAFLYGPEYASGAANVLRLYSFCAFLGYIQMVVIAALTAGQKTRQIFIGSIAGCIVAIFLGPTCIWFMGTNGAIVNMIIVTLIVTTLYVRTYMKEFVADEGDPIAATEALV